VYVCTGSVDSTGLTACSGAEQPRFCTRYAGSETCTIGIMIETLHSVTRTMARRVARQASASHNTVYIVDHSARPTAGIKVSNQRPLVINCCPHC